jgi:hypothetical protein
MQRKHGLASLGPADGPVKRAIFDENSAVLYRYDRRPELETDRIAVARATYEREGPGPDESAIRLRHPADRVINGSEWRAPAGGLRRRSAALVPGSWLGAARCRRGPSALAG